MIFNESTSILASNNKEDYLRYINIISNKY